MSNFHHDGARDHGDADAGLAEHRPDPGGRAAARFGELHHAPQ
jgi:hypothetical protein